VLALALTFPLWGCPPTLSGEACNGDCACPDRQSCVFAAAGDAVGSCQDGTNACSSLRDGGLDAGDAGDAGDGGGNPDAGDAGGSNTAFQGVVVLNGSATPPNTAKVYGFADGLPIAQGGVYATSDVELTNNSGVFVFPDPQSPPTGTGYRLAAVYDTKGRGDYSLDDPGIFSGLSANDLAPGSSQALAMRIDVQTSTCFSITTDLGQANAGAGLTYFLGLGAVAVDIRTGAPLVSQTDLDVVSATFDAGSTLPASGGFLGNGIVNLEPVAEVPGFGIESSWFYPIGPAKADVGPLSNEGTFYIQLTDGSHGQPQYPSGACNVAYQPPPGFPVNIAINGVDAGAPDSGVLWPGVLSGSGPGGPGSKTNRVSWDDFNGALPGEDTFVGDFVAILGPLPDGGTEQLFPDGGQLVFARSPVNIAPGVVPLGVCDQGSKSVCAIEVTSFYLDAHKARASAYEGGTTLLPFQRTSLIPNN
jgi:hypothetical protein